MNFTRRNLLILAAVAGIAAAPVAALAEGVLNVGSYPNNPPFEFKNESGVFEGFEVGHRVFGSVGRHGRARSRVGLSSRGSSWASIASRARKMRERTVPIGQPMRAAISS